MSRTDACQPGTEVRHRRYVSFAEAHYAGNLVDGAFCLALFGDAATEMCILTDGDEGLFASYDRIDFHAPVHAGDVLEVSAVLTEVGTRSRRMRFEARVVARGRHDPDRPSAAEMLAEPLVAVSATGTCVVPL